MTFLFSKTRTRFLNLSSLFHRNAVVTGAFPSTPLGAYSASPAHTEMSTKLAPCIRPRDLMVARLTIYYEHPIYHQQPYGRESFETVMGWNSIEFRI